MNNPLAVMSGRSQQLAASLEPGTEQAKAAQTIVEQTGHLSDLITPLQLFADPPSTNRRLTDLRLLLREVIQHVRRDLNALQQEIEVDLHVQIGLPNVLIDPDQIPEAITELLHNAFQAGPQMSVCVSARIDPSHNQLIMQVSDDGERMDNDTLRHAMDPFL